MIAVIEVYADHFVCKLQMERPHILIQIQALAWTGLAFRFKLKSLRGASSHFDPKFKLSCGARIFTQKQALAWSVLTSFKFNFWWARVCSRI